MQTVQQFEKEIAKFFGAPYAVATDSCTHALELCLRFTKPIIYNCPKNTYISVPFLAAKLGIAFAWDSFYQWEQYYYITPKIIDAATIFERDSYIKETFTCISFQYQKHLSLGRGGAILCDNKKAYDQLKKMSYDGRLPGIPWRDQDIDTMGYHYYMTPETAAIGLEKLPAAIATEPKIWSWKDYPDLSLMKIFK